MAGVALGDIDFHFAWQAWHLRRHAVGAAAVCVAGVALGDIDCHFAWQAWHLWHWVGAWFAFGAVGAASLCLAGVALGDMDLHFAWQVVTWTCTLRGRRGTYGTELALVARLVPIWRRGPRLFAWQAWHLGTSTSTLRGRRGTCRHGRALSMAGVALMALGWRAGFPFGAVGTAAVCKARVALGDSDLHFAWQAWQLATWTCTCVAGVALDDMDVHFAWQALHLLIWTCTLRGRRGTW